MQHRPAAIGLVDQVAPSAKLDDTIAEMIDGIVANSSVAIAAFKRILSSTPGNWREVMEAEARESVACVAASDTRMRLFEFLNRRNTTKS